VDQADALIEGQLGVQQARAFVRRQLGVHPRFGRLGRGGRGEHEDGDAGGGAQVSVHGGHPQ
jgi:hypothetical protein